MAERTKVLIMGAAGRDFHNFNTYFRDREEYEIVAFTATQIPYINDRKYPAELAGPHYPDGIPIHDESEMPELVKKYGVEQVVFAYSDVPYEYVMHRSALVNSLGADFLLMGPDKVMVKSTKPVIAVCAVRTGAGKSQTTRKIQTMLREAGKKVVSIRHPMPYGDLVAQRVQRYATLDDLKKYECTIEEMEEYEPHVMAGNVIYAGVDYEAIVREAEKEADVILWDGGNNDFSFYAADLYITVADPHRPGDGLVYYPGEVNLRLADVVVLNKIDTADRAGIEAELEAVRSVNPTAQIIMGASPITVDKPELIKGKRVLVVEDGPTLTHGEMKYGAGTVAARQFGAAEFIDPRPFAVGEIKATFEKYPNVGVLLPAMGYSEQQLKDLETTINASGADVVVIGTPMDLRRIIDIKLPAVQVGYDLQEIGSPTLADVLRERGSSDSLSGVRHERPRRRPALTRRPSPRRRPRGVTPPSVPAKGVPCPRRPSATSPSSTSPAAASSPSTTSRPPRSSRLLDLAAELKDAQKRRAPHPLLAGRAVAMIFMKTTTRTRMSFEVGIEQLGAQPIFLNANDIQLRVGETIKDTANVMSRYVDCIMIRTFAQKDVEDLAEYGQIPVINGLTDDHHPCQGMADALTIREHCGRLEGVKLVYIGDGNNVTHSLAEVGAKTGMHVVVCTPRGLPPGRGDHRPGAGGRRRRPARPSSSPTTSRRPCAAPTSSTPTRSRAWARRRSTTCAWRRSATTRSTWTCSSWPARRSRSCTACRRTGARRSPKRCCTRRNSVVFDQAENRLHAQKAIMAAVIA